MKQFKAKIISNRKIAPEHYILSFKRPEKERRIEPGQFFYVKISDSYRPLLRKPFSVHKISGYSIEILYKTIGEGTRALSKRKKGDILDMMGPLGKGFDAVRRHKKVMLVGGGHGVAPLYALAKQLEYPAVPAGRLSIFIGARTKDHIVCDKKFRRLGARVYIATDDGTRGHKGFVTDLLTRKILGSRDKDTGEGRGKGHTAIYACGPKEMLKSVWKVARRYGIPCQFSLEEYMACGIGTCLGCAVKTQSGYKLVCKDGPVFDAKEIVW
ncbi:MAG: hypothetical protein A2Z72_01560 [Omnitrophica bacterium RBG_13_46_9]|nr:MAG: hypothetical protein A2Z72_01560 [Omnitrophica bacterium RBG_13_46_9]